MKAIIIILVADSGNHRIQKFTAGGFLSAERASNAIEHSEAALDCVTCYCTAQQADPASKGGGRGRSASCGLDIEWIGWDSYTAL